MAKASDNIFPRLLISEGGSTATPGSGEVTVYAKSDGLLYSKDDAGAETALGASAGSTIIVKDEGGALATAADTLDFVGAGVVASGTGTTKTITIAGGGGGSAAVPTLVQYKIGSAGAVTLDAAPVNGHTLLAYFHADTSNVTAVTSTGTVWTELATFSDSVGKKCSLWSGVVGSGASASITWTAVSSNAAAVSEITDTLTGTVGVTASGSPANTLQTLMAASTAGNIIVAGACRNDYGGAFGWYLSLSIPTVGVSLTRGTQIPMLIGYSQGYPVAIVAQSDNDAGMLAAEVS